MNEKLQSVLNKILQLTEQNSEFGVELRRKLGITSSVKATSYPSGFDKRVEHIEKYLGLDYYVDGQPSLIDYSFVKETEIRAQLISDNREMMRHRYGTRFHIINFDEYCRYAHLQVEMLLNYYYDRVDNTFDEIKKKMWYICSIVSRHFNMFTTQLAVAAWVVFKLGDIHHQLKCYDSNHT
jgi:hypothetical protein